MIGEAERLVSTCLQGVYQSHQATASAVQVNNINLLRGMIGRPGCAPFQMNGQPTAQNTRETGRRRRPWRRPQLAEPCAYRTTCQALERRAAADPALGAADSRDADLPLRRGRLDPIPLGDRHKPRRVVA